MVSFSWEILWLLVLMIVFYVGDHSYCQAKIWVTTFGSWAISNLDFDGKQRHNPGLELCTHDIFNYECWSGFRTVVLKLVLINVVILSGCSWVFFGKLLVVNWTPQSIISSECIRSYKTYKYHTGVRSWFRLELGRNLCDIWQSSWTHSYSRITYTPISLGHDNIYTHMYMETELGYHCAYRCPVAPNSSRPSAGTTLTV